MKIHSTLCVEVQMSKLKTQNYILKLKSLLRIGILLFIFHSAFYILHFGSATAQSRLQYPIQNLGDCRDAKECRLYCEIPQNKPACWSYGKFILELDSGLPAGRQVLGEDAASEEEKAKELGIKFPVAELGDCENVRECKSYCENPDNKEACIEFARNRGLGRYKKHKELVEKAKEKLGCETYLECRRYCAAENNKERCSKFGQENMPEEIRQKKEEILQGARENLGCDSYESCRSYCEIPENKERCAEFGKKHIPTEVRRYMDQTAPEQDHPGVGNTRDLPYRAPAAEEGRGLPECKTELECARICEENPNKCPGYERGYYEKAKDKIREFTKEELDIKKPERPTDPAEYEEYRKQFKDPGSLD